MFRASGYFALVLALPTVVACGESYDSSVSGVFPSSAFLGRSMRVEISGDVTEWKAGATVNFGPGVTVSNVAVASPTALFADIQIAPDAEPGLRDVTVESGGSTQVLAQAFQLESAISLKFRGSLAQGSIAAFTIVNRDFETPFDTTATGDGFFTPLEYTNTSITASNGVLLSVGSVEPYTITGTAFFDVDAAPGPLQVNSGPAGEEIVSALGVNLEVAARTATALTNGMATPGNVAGAFESALYEFTPTGSPALATFAVSSTSMAAAPGVALLPASGKFADLMSYGATGAVVQPTAEKVYAVYFDQDGGSGYNYSIKASGQMLTPMAEAEPNNTPAAAQNAATMPVLVTGATLANVDDEDWITINITAAEAGKRIRVVTTGDDPLTDTVVEVQKPNGDAFGGPSADRGYHENHTSPVIPAATLGAYRVKISASVEYFESSHNAYVAAIWVE